MEWELFQTNVVEKIKTHILCSVTFPRKSYRLWDNVGKVLYRVAGHRWQYGALRIVCWINKTMNIHSECVTNYRFSVTTTVVQTRMNVTLQHVSVSSNVIQVILSLSYIKLFGQWPYWVTDLLVYLHCCNFESMLPVGASSYFIPVAAIIHVAIGFH